MRSRRMSLRENGAIYTFILLKISVSIKSVATYSFIIQRKALLTVNIVIFTFTFAWYIYFQHKLSTVTETLVLLIKVNNI